jgi:hypothetical protein
MCVSSLASAQGIAIDPLPRAGDCTLRFSVPPNTKASDVTVTLDSDTAPLTVTIIEGSPFVARLGQPLSVNSKITIKAGAASVTAIVQPPPDQVQTAVTVCAANARTSISDDREVFEASGFLGEVFDNFAPKIDGGYANEAAASNINSRLTAGVDAQYRLIGKKGDLRQLWVVAHTLHGMRTADANCTDIAACEQAHGSAAETFKYILAHASTMEAHVEGRFEFLAIQPDTEVPAKVFAYAHVGFLDLEGAPRVYDANHIGVGIVAPKGVFRQSYAQVGWGVSKQYETDTKWDRLRVNGVLMFDLLPNITPGNFFKDLGAGARFFVAIAIDRNVQTGPDAVHTCKRTSAPISICGGFSVRFEASDVHVPPKSRARVPDRCHWRDDPSRLT